MYGEPLFHFKDGSFLDKLLGSVNFYGICFAIGIIVCLYAFIRYTRKKGMSDKAQNFFYFTAIIAIAGGYFASAVWQGIYNYIEDPSAGFSLTGGITFIGGLMGGVITFVAVYFIFGYKKYKSEWSKLIEVAPVCVLVAHFFGRIGCFLGGCCYGAETDSWLGVDFPGIGKVLPVQLYEALFLLGMFILLSYLYTRTDCSILFSIYLIGYGVWRFAIEFLRGDDRGAFVGSLSPSQFWSVVMVIGGIGLIIFHYVMLKKYNKNIHV